MSCYYISIWTGLSISSLVSTPCPIGDECPAGQICFAGSPCAALLREALEKQTPSNVGSYCGSSWNALLVECESARLCPQGNECDEGEMCYRNFVCDPPETLAPTKKITPAPSAVPTHKTTAEKPASMDLHQGLNQETNLSSSTASSGQEYIDEETVDGSEPSTQSPTSISARAEPTTSSSGNIHQVSEFRGTCSLCGDAGAISSSISVSYNGRPFPCDGFQDVFDLNEIQDGSGLCLNFRQEYSSSCCAGQSPDTQEPQETHQKEAPCLLCILNGKEYEVARDVTVILSGAEHTCLDLSQSLLDISQLSEQCTETKVSLFKECCDADEVPVQSPARSPGVSEANRLGGGLVKSPQPPLTGFDVDSWYSAHNGSSPLRSANLIVTIVMVQLCRWL